MTPHELSRQLRKGTGKELGRRRAIIGLSLTATASMGLISLYQTGVIAHLPEPPLPGLNSDKVDASDEAYKHFSMPDAPLGLVSYASTLALAAMGSRDRARTHPWMVLALAGKLGFDLAQALRLTYQQPAHQHAYCFWCLVASAATVISVPLAIPETRAAIQRSMHAAESH